MTELMGTGQHLTSTELRLWTSFLDASRIIETELANQLETEFGMTHREYEILVRLDGAGGSNRMSILARQIEASPALVSQTVSRLVERGWVKRQTSTQDRRGVEAALTAKGRDKLATAAKPHAELVLALLIEPMRAKQRDHTAEALGAIADHLRAHRRGESCDLPSCPLG